MPLRGWRLGRQQFPPSLHLTVPHAHANVADQFLDDLEQAVAKVKRFSFNKLVDSLKVGLVQAAVRLLPAKVVSEFAARASSVMGLEGGQLPKRSAAMYGMMASLPNKSDGSTELNEIVLDLLDQLTQSEERWVLSNVDEITIFKSVGLAIQDVSTATKVYQLAKEKGVDKTLSLMQAVSERYAFRTKSLS